ncbi:electron transfer flavoprotein-ubiquinone oxidoreductase [Desulfonema magnum]|uniref:Electron transfer flavoprotein-ubiquinone oxidoreductase n=1 Tax=Desulfonema magnum TaxID=45655 RepID=A0A975BMN5_9BACT|nr:electron transfer flavoprotein-ubiquinone oxidoreductase [Desulfonema magnum]QTA88357.1 FAD/NAD(P)-binding domain-containing protein [Desulfonema magnum]
MNTERESIEFDILFVGGGPASLAGAIKLMQLAKEKNTELEVALIEKGADIGSHALSGAVLNPIALKELIPDFMEKGCPIEATVREDEFYFLTQNNSRRLPFISKYMHNKGFYVISLSRFTKWLAEIAEDMGVNIFPGFAGKEVLYAPDQKTIVGVRTGDKGLGKDGEPKGNFEPGMDLLAKVTVFGEGARGSLTQEIGQKLDIFSGKMPQVYETGIKEVIQLPEDNYFATSDGNDIHTFGYPLGLNIPGGGFIYEMTENQIALGFLVGLSYENPMLDLYDEFMKFKQHPFVADIIRNGKVLEQGARTVSTGGYFTMPRLATHGGMFIGGSAAMQNSPALKGIHVSMKSGMLAAEACAKALEKDSFTRETLEYYPQLFEKSWARQEIYEGRNFSQALSKKVPAKFIHLGAQYFTKGKGIRDRLPSEEDCTTFEQARENRGRTDFNKNTLDGVLYVDKLTGVYLSKTMHREDQPPHIIVHDPNLCVNACYETYKNPCTRFCPGNVYEIETDEKTSRRQLKLNPSNCLHCKTCDIKDPYRNITWTCPEGGDGPGYAVL